MGLVKWYQILVFNYVNIGQMQGIDSFFLIVFCQFFVGGLDSVFFFWCGYIVFRQGDRGVNDYIVIGDYFGFSISFYKFCLVGIIGGQQCGGVVCQFFGVIWLVMEQCQMGELDVVYCICVLYCYLQYIGGFFLYLCCGCCGWCGWCCCCVICCLYWRGIYYGCQQVCQNDFFYC